MNEKYTPIDFKQVENDPKRRCGVCAFAYKKEKDWLNCVYNKFSVFPISSCRHFLKDHGSKGGETHE